MSAVNDRLADYLRRPATCCTDPRWQAIMEDIAMGWIWLDRRDGGVRIVVRAA